MPDSPGHLRPDFKSAFTQDGAAVGTRNATLEDVEGVDRRNLTAVLTATQVN